MTLGHYFSSDDQEDYINRQLKPGQVVYLFSHFTDPPKEKYLVIAYYQSNPLLFVINSAIHSFIASTPELNRCQIRLQATEYDFLNHNSYINCSEVIKVITSFDEDQIRSQISGDLSRAKGELSQVTKNEIIRVVRSARTISRRHKHLITNALKP